MNEFFLYIDPGTTSAMFAAILGAVAGGVMFIKTKWHSIRYRNQTKK